MPSDIMTLDDRRQRDVTRFFKYVQRTEGCHLWTGYIHSNGYGQFSADGHHVAAHRWIYEQIVGPIPKELDTDHLCHNEDPSCPGGWTCLHRRCVRIDHLEPATRIENALRGKIALAHKIRVAKITHCPAGHPYSDDNLLITVDGTRDCRACNRAKAKRYYWRNPEKCRARARHYQRYGTAKI